MDHKDVPQDKSPLFGEFHEIQYAVGADGRYVKEKSSGWGPKTTANSQFWKTLLEQVQMTVGRIRRGQVSPLAYYMEIRQMDIKLLSDYVGQARWRTLRHLKPSVFDRLSPNVLERYARIFKVSVDDLRRLPDDAEHPRCIASWAELTD